MRNAIQQASPQANSCAPAFHTHRQVEGKKAPFSLAGRPIHGCVGHQQPDSVIGANLQKDSCHMFHIIKGHRIGVSTLVYDIANRACMDAPETPAPAAISCALLRARHALRRELLCMCLSPLDASDLCLARDVEGHNEVLRNPPPIPHMNQQRGSLC